MIELLYLFVGWIFVIVFGRKIRGFFGLKESFLLNLLFDTAFGFAALILVVFIASAFHLLYSWLLATVFIISFLVCFKEFKQLLSDFKKIRLNWLAENKIFSIVVFVYVLVNLVGALSPTADTDGLGYHLAMPKLYIQNHGFAYHPLAVSNWPMTFEMLYLLALMFKNDVLAKLVHWFFGLLCTLAVYSFAKSFFSKKAASVSAVLFYTMPLVALESGIAYVDLSWVFFAIIGLHCFFEWYVTNKKEFFFPSAIFLGISASAKWNGPLLVVIVFLGLLVRMYQNKSLWKNILFFLVISSSFSFLWYGKNLVLSGNPVLPFLGSVFPTENWSADNSASYSEVVSGKEVSLKRFILMPWYLTISTNHFGFGELAFLGPVLLGLLPLVFFGRKNPVRKLLLIGMFLFYTAWFVSSQQVRLLFLIFPFICVLISAGLSENPFNPPIKKFLWALITISIVLNLALPLAYHSKGIPFVLGIESKDSYLNRLLPEFAVMQWANQNLAKDSYTYFFGTPHGFYFDNRYLWGCKDMQGVLKIEDSNPQKFIKDINSLKISHLLVNKNVDSCPNSKELLASKEVKSKLKELFAKNNVVLYEIK